MTSNLEQTEVIKEAPNDLTICIVREGPISVKGERQYVFRYADGIESTHREKTKRFTSQIQGKEIQRTPEEVELVRSAIREWKVRYPDDCPEVLAKREEHLSRSSFWVRCMECGKNRKMPHGVKKSGVKKRWRCSFNTDPAHNSCKAEEEPEATRVCQHADHEEWHPRVPRKQPLSGFYGRLRVCALCHKMRSKNSSKRNRVNSVLSPSLIVDTKRKRIQRHPVIVDDEILDDDEEMMYIKRKRKTRRKKRKPQVIPAPPLQVAPAVVEGAPSQGLDMLFSALQDDLEGIQ